ncbi:MAG: BatA protein [Myxococcales bacterium]
MGDLHFAQPWFLLLLVAVVAGAAWVVTRWRRGDGALRYANTPTLDRVGTGVLVRLVRLPDVLRLFALALLVVAMARPQVPDNEVLQGEGVDVMLALDMSGSMQAVDRTPEEIRATLAERKTPKNRFEVARSVLMDFVGSRNGDRVGLVIFGEKAFLKFPLTLDYARVRAILRGLVLDNGERARGTDTCSNGCTISGAGTAIGDAMSRAWRRLQQSKTKTKVMVLITDGANEGGKLQPETVLEYIATRPKDEKVRIFTFLVGDETKTHVPMRNPWGEVSYERPNRPFTTNPQLLRTIAERTGGKYFESYDEDKFREDWKELEKTTFETKVRWHDRDVFPPFVLIAGALIGLEVVLRATVLRKFP